MDEIIRLYEDKLLILKSSIKYLRKNRLIMALFPSKNKKNLKIFIKYNLITRILAIVGLILICFFPSCFIIGIVMTLLSIMNFYIGILSFEYDDDIKYFKFQIKSIKRQIKQYKKDLYFDIKYNNPNINISTNIEEKEIIIDDLNNKISK